MRCPRCHKPLEGPACDFCPWEEREDFWLEEPALVQRDRRAKDKDFDPPSMTDWQRDIENDHMRFRD
jgi:hypothetical protein